MTTIKHVRIYDYENYIEDGFIRFNETIQEVGKMSDYVASTDHIINGYGMLLLPSFVNGHSHIYSALARGLSVPFSPTTFKEILEQLWWKVDRNLTLESVKASTLVSGVEYVRHGVTTIIDHHASGIILGTLDTIHQELDTIGIRHMLCFETSDRFDVDDCIEENIAFMQKNNTSTSRGLFGLHAAFTLSDDTLRKVADNLNNEPIHIHVAESKEDQDHSLKQYNKRVIPRLDTFGLITEDSILCHGNYLTNEELKTIQKRNAVIALNITSNMNNGVGTPDIKTMMNQGLRLIIGNDGISRSMTSEYKSLYYAMHHKYRSHTVFTLDDLKLLIQSTYQYASKRLGIQLGKIEPGYQSDFLLIPYVPISPINQDNMFGHLFFGLFEDMLPNAVFINGKKIISNYVIPSELVQAYKQAHSSAKALWDAIEKEGQQ